MSRFREWRLDWIDDRLAMGESFYRSELCEFFGVSGAQGSLDIQEFQRLYTVETPFGPRLPMRLVWRLWVPNRPFRSRRRSTAIRRAAWNAIRPKIHPGVPEMTSTEAKPEAKPEATTDGPTIVTFLLDRTGSMEEVRDVTIGAFNEYLDGLRFAETAIRFTLLQFDSLGVETTVKNQPVALVPPLTRDTYQPRASTPLIDAAYKTIKAVEKMVKEQVYKPKVVICIQTDGQENCSVEYTFAQLNALIKTKTGEGWQFIFMGAGIDAYGQGRQMGIGHGQTISYGKGARQTESAFFASAVNTVSFAGGQSTNTAFTRAQKDASGDRFNMVKGQDPAAQGQVEQAKAQQPPPPKARTGTVDDIDL